MRDTTQLQIEAVLASAHRSLWTAAQLAESRRDQSLSDDLYQLRNEVERLQLELLAGRGRRSARPS